MSSGIGGANKKAAKASAAATAVGGEFGPKAEFESKWRSTKTHTSEQMMSVYQELYFAGFPCADRDKNLFMPDALVKSTFESYGTISKFTYDVYRGIGSVTFADPEDSINCFLHGNYKMLLAQVPESLGCANFPPQKKGGTSNKKNGGQEGNYFLLYLEFAMYLPFVNTLLLSPHLRRTINRQLLRTFPRPAESGKADTWTSQDRAHPALRASFEECREHILIHHTQADGGTSRDEKTLLCLSQWVSPATAAGIVEQVESAATVVVSGDLTGNSSSSSTPIQSAAKKILKESKLAPLETQLDLWWVYWVAFVRPLGGVSVPKPMDVEEKRRRQAALIGTPYTSPKEAEEVTNSRSADGGLNASRQHKERGITRSVDDSLVEDRTGREVFDFPEKVEPSGTSRGATKKQSMMSTGGARHRVDTVMMPSFYAEVMLSTRKQYSSGEVKSLNSPSKNKMAVASSALVGAGLEYLWAVDIDNDDGESADKNNGGNPSKKCLPSGLTGSEDRRMTVNMVVYVVRFDLDFVLQGLCCYLSQQGDLSCHVSLNTAATDDTRLNEEILGMTEDPEEQSPFGIDVVQMAANCLARSIPDHNINSAMKLLDRHAVSASRASILRCCGPLQAGELDPMTWWEVGVATLQIIRPAIYILLFLLFIIVGLPRFLPEGSGPRRQDEVSEFIHHFK